MLETLNGDPIPGTFSARRLWRFIPKEGTKMAEDQKLVEERHAREEVEERDRETAEVAEERKEKSTPASMSNDMSTND